MFNERLRKAALSTAAGAGVMLASGAVTAAPIEGSAAFSGVANAFQDADGSGTQVTDFTQGTSVVTDDTLTDFDSGTGDFSGFGQTSVNSFADFDYNPVDGGEFPFTEFWSVTLGGEDYTMDVSSFTVSNIQSNQFDFSGVGTVNSTASNLDPTPGTITGSFNSEGASVSFSSTSASAAIPVPATFLLLGVGLVGLGLVGRRC